MKLLRNKAIKLDWWGLLGFTRTDPQFRPIEDEVEYRIKRLVIERDALLANCDHLGREITVLREQNEVLHTQLWKLLAVDNKPPPEELP